MKLRVVLSEGFWGSIQKQLRRNNKTFKQNNKVELYDLCIIGKQYNPDNKSLDENLNFFFCINAI